MGAETHQNLEQVDSEKELSSWYEESKKEYSKSENNEGKCFLIKQLI